MNIVVAGAAGFLGSHLCDALLSEGHFVIGVDNFLTGQRKNIDRIQQQSNSKQFRPGDYKPSKTNALQVVKGQRKAGSRSLAHNFLRNSGAG